MASDAPTSSRRGRKVDGDPTGLFQDPRTGMWCVRKTWSRGPGLKRGELTASLGTKKKAEALRAYPMALAALQAKAEGRREKPLTEAETVAKFRKLLAKTETASDWGEDKRGNRAWAEYERPTAAAEAEYEAEIERRLGPVVGSVPETGEPMYAPGREAMAHEFADAVAGRAVSVDLFLDAFLDGKALRYASRIKKAVRQLVAFLRDRPEGNAVKAVKRRTASDFIAHLVKAEPSITTAKSKVSALSSFWDWLVSRDDADENVWKGHKMPKRPGKADVRPYTTAEMVALLEGDAPQYMADFIRAGALTGMRREEISRLRVKDCAGGWFDIKAGKNKNAIRKLPIHPELVEIVARRSTGKAADAFLFDDLPKSDGKGRGRSEKLGDRFRDYRRSVCVDDRREDGRSRIDFHSFRRWFCTEAVRHSGEPDWAVSEIVGHETGPLSETIRTYYAGSLDTTMEKIVRSVRLPTRADLQNTEGPREEAA